MKRACSSLVVLGAAFAALTLAGERDARACGGCFHEPTPNPSESTLVTDHRMAFSISTHQTVLWDQVRYTGDPKEFVWVLPVHPGTRVELSHDEWIAALDASTQPIVNAPARTYPSAGFGDGTGGGLGCGCLGGSTSASTFADDKGGAAPEPPPPPVDVISQQVVGPYETVTLRSTDPKALETWLISHGYDIPVSVRPTIDAYTSEGFDFIALRLRPGQGVRAMRPVRVVTPGADASLPLRMVAAGVGQSVGLTLYVIGSGRYEAQNFPNATVDDTKLTWDFTQNRSNYQQLTQDLMAQANGRTWVTEYSNRPSVFTALGGAPVGPSRASGNPGLASAYFTSCGAARPSYTFQAFDAGDDAGDASSDGSPSDAASDGSSDASSTDGGADASDDGGTACFGACCDFDDLNVAMTGLTSSDVFLTRLRANFPVEALKVGDLRLIASQSQSPVQNVHNASDPNAAPVAKGAGLVGPMPSRAGLFVTIGLSILALSQILRRRRRS